MPSINDMTVGSPTRDIIRFAVPLVGGYILQQMYLLIDAAIVGRFVGVDALAAVGASSSIMFRRTTPRCAPTWPTRCASWP